MRIERVGSSRGGIRLSVDGRVAATPGEVLTGPGPVFVCYLASTRWEDDGSRPSPAVLEAVGKFLKGPGTLVE